MLRLKDVRANMIHGYGMPDAEVRESVVEVILLLSEPEYIAKPIKGKAAFKVEQAMRLESFRCLASADDLRHAAQLFAALAAIVEQEHADLQNGTFSKPAAAEDPQKSFLNEGVDEGGGEDA